MQTITPTPLPIRARHFASGLRVIALAGAVAIATACHDGATDPLAPVSPSLNVSSNGTWLVNSLADPGDGTCSNNECTLREAITAAQGGDRITFKGNLSGRVALSAGALFIDKSLTIEGPGARVLTVSAQSASRVFEIGPPAGPAVIVSISGLSILGGFSSGSGGGVIVNASSRLALIASVVSGSTAGRGGGIYNLGTLTLVATTVAGNFANSDGGGILSDGESLTISRSTISGNRTNSLGGGVFVCTTTSTCPGNLTLRSTTITKNHAAVQAGGLYLNELGATGTAFNAIIAGNTTDQGIHECIAPNIISLGYNLTTDQQCTALDAATDIRVPASQVFTAVLETLLADNGGRVPTHALIERGFAIDAGWCPGEGFDQRGFPRPYDDLRVPNALDGCDIGAFEWQPSDTKNGQGPKP